MKPRFFTTLLCSFFICFSFSQDNIYSLNEESLNEDNYVPMLSGTNWQIFTFDFSITYCTAYTADSSYVFPGMDNAYQIRSMSSSYPSKYWMFEDVATERVWFYREDVGMTAPELIYDFSLNVGDFVQVTSGGNGAPISLTVTEVSYYNSPIGPLKRLVLEDFPCRGPIEWIEGIGCTETIFYPYLAFCDPIPYVDKVWKNNQLIYDTGYECSDVCAVSYMSENEIRDDYARLSWGRSLAYGWYDMIRWREVGAQEWVEEVVDNTTYELTDLNPNAMYEWQIAKYCSEPDLYYSAMRQFMTDPVSVTSIQEGNVSLWHQNNTIRIERSNEQPADFFVYDMNGKLIYTQEIRQNTSIDINLPNGIYVGYFREKSGEQYSGKFVVAD